MLGCRVKAKGDGQIRIHYQIPINGFRNPNKISTKASRRGTKVHKLCEDYLNNESAFQGYTPDNVDMFKTIQPTLNEIEVVYAQERTLFSHHLKTAGRVDCVGKFRGKTHIIDFKTSTKYKREEWIQDYFSQETAYAIMFQELTGLKVKQLVTIIATEQGTPQIFVKNNILEFVPKLKEYIDYYKEIHGDW